jgi:N-acetylglucosamine malate deacetylase 1
MNAKTKFHPRAFIDAMLTYPRFLGTIKPTLLRGASSELEPRLAMYQQAWWPKRLESPLAKRILALSPHPDDESIGCGGLLLAHAGTANITIVNVYNGDGGGALEEGPWHNNSEYRAKLVEMRARELDQAAAILQADQVIRFGVSDCDGAPGPKEAAALRVILQQFAPEIVLLPWMLDNHPHHRMTNRLFAEAAQGLSTMVLGYEIWTLLTPNAFFDFTELQDRKRKLISQYVSQLRTVDYITYVEGLANTRAFHLLVSENRSGSVEAYLALPCEDYCNLVFHAIS